VTYLPQLPSPDLDQAGAVTEPLVLIDLDDPPASAPPADGRLLVGVSTRPLPEAAVPLLGDLDLTIVPEGASVRREAVAVRDPEAEARELQEATARSPQAALVLGQVLRASAGLPVPAALDVESFAYSMLLGGAEFRRWLAGNGGRALPPMVEDPVLIGRDSEDVLRVTLNRPERRNAYGRQLRDALTDALRVALLDPSVDRVVLDGAGPCFCSGGDLAEFGTAPNLVTAHFVRTLAGAGRLVHALRDRLEVHVHGPCVGAGVELPAFAGRVIAAAGTTFTLPEVAMGLIPGAGGTVSISRRVGRWRALYLALSGQSLDAATALTWGLIDEIAGLLVGRDGVRGRPGVGAPGAAQHALGEATLGEHVQLERLSGQPEPQEAGQRVAQEHRGPDHGQDDAAEGDVDRGARRERVAGALRDQVADHAERYPCDHERHANVLPEARVALGRVGDLQVGELAGEAVSAGFGGGHWRELPR
jgi:enoyl-CoA hydratase/carnithine racemase